MKNRSFSLTYNYKANSDAFRIRVFLYFGILISLFAIQFTLLRDAQASTLINSLSDRGTFVFPSGGTPSTTSYDGPGRDTMQDFSSFAGPTLYQANSFTGYTGGGTVHAFMLSELASFDGSVPGFANNFGVVDSSNTFTSMINTDVNNPLATGSIAQAESQELTFALQSPEGLFYSVDSRNPDGGVAHMLALKVENPGTVTLPKTNLQGAGPLSFNLQVGDVILFIEDMRVSGNISTSLVPFASDFDYNDMVVVVRQTAVPEPATMLLFGIGMAGAAMRKRRQQ